MVRKKTMNTLNVSSVSAIRVSQSASAARCTGMWFTDRTLGIGTYIPMGCMLMRSRHSATRFGGIGATALIAGGGTMVGDGIVLTILGDMLRVIGAVGMAATGVAGMAATGVAGMAAVAIGAIITTGMAVPTGAGAVVEDLIMPAIPTRIVALTATIISLLLLHGEADLTPTADRQ